MEEFCEQDKWREREKRRVERYQDSGREGRTGEKERGREGEGVGRLKGMPSRAGQNTLGIF